MPSRKPTPEAAASPRPRRVQRQAQHANSASADLRQRIIDTSRALLDEQGAAAISLREVARRAGVTHQAPYHHFADRESILAELVTQGFDELARRLARARKAGQTPHQCLVASGQAYVSFALDQPGVFRIMFRQDLCDSARFSATVEAGARAHGELMQMVQMVQTAHLSVPQGSTAGPATEMLANLHWAQVHGLACLLLDGPLGLRLPTDAQRRAHVRQAMDAFAARMLAPTAGT